LPVQGEAAGAHGGGGQRPVTAVGGGERYAVFQLQGERRQRLQVMLEQEQRIVAPLVAGQAEGAEYPRQSVINQGLRVILQALPVPWGEQLKAIGP